MKDRMLKVMAVCNFFLLVLIVFIFSNFMRNANNRIDKIGSKIYDTLEILAPATFGNDVLINIDKLKNITNKFDFDDIVNLDVYQLDDSGSYVISRNKINGALSIGVNVGFVDDMKSYRFYPITINIRNVSDSDLYNSIINAKIEQK